MSGTLDARPVAPRYREYRPHPALAPWVRCYWTIAAEDAAPTPNRICPDGCADIIVDLGAPAPPVGRTGGLRAYAVGTMRSPVVVPMSGRIDMIGIRFRPGGARAFLGVPLVQLTDRTAPLEALGWRGVAILEEQLAESAEPAVRLSRLEEALSCRRAGTRARAGAGTPGAIDLLERTHGALSIRDVTRATGLSGRALERAFRDAVGVSPKRFARIVRFRGAVSLLQRHPGLRPARVAADLEYYDEAHLIRDFRELAGTTPAAFAREGRDVGFVQYGAPGSATP